MAELAAADMVAGIGLAAHQHRAAHSVLQRQIGEIPLRPARIALGKTAGRAVVVDADGIGETPRQLAERHVAQPERRSKEDARPARRQQPRDRHAHAEDPAAIEREFVDEILDDAPEIRRAGRQIGHHVVGHRVIGKLPQPQIGRHKAQTALRDRHAQRYARLRHDVQPLGAAAAGELALAGIVDKPGRKQLAEILIQCRHADLAARGQRLLRAELPGFIQRAIDPAADRVVFPELFHVVRSSFRPVCFQLYGKKRPSQVLFRNFYKVALQIKKLFFDIMPNQSREKPSITHKKS